MIRVCHLFDASAGWEQRVACTQLVNRLPEERYRNILATIGTRAPACLDALNGPVRNLAAFWPRTITVAPALARYLAAERIDLLHTWGLAAAMSARAASNRPLAIELFDPSITRAEVKAVRTIAHSRNLAVICSSATLRRRLIEGGVPPELCVVVRPGVDFALIRGFRQASLRQELGMEPDDLVVITPEDATGAGAQDEAFWAVALASLFVQNVRIIMPGLDKQGRIARFAETMPDPEILISPGPRYPFEQLIANANVLIVAPRGDAPTTSIAWAMAANVAVIGSAVYCVAELIADKLNGLLFKPEPGQAMGVTLARLLQEDAALAKVREVARGHAYEVFGVTRCVEQHARVYENMLGGRPPGDGIVDSAVSA